MYACIHAPDAGELARNFSPWVEMVDASTAVFRITPRQMAGLPAGVRMAVAPAVETAILAARSLPGLTRIQAGEEARVLGALPVDALPPDAEMFATLDRWGIRTLGELAELPEHGVAERMGERGLRLQRLARGALDRPLDPETAAEALEESAEMEHGIELREPLLFLIGRFLSDLAARMQSRSLAAQELRLTLNRQERVLRLPFPTRDVKLLLKLVEHSLERQPPEEPVERAGVALIPTPPRRVQHGLFTPAAPEPEKLELTLGKIRALVGEKNVGYPELFDTHRPEAGKPVSFLPRLAFRRFRPTLEARVETEAGAPKQVWTRMFRGRVVQAAGPWRSSGDWWRASTGENAAWDREEWDVALGEGELYRVSRTGHSPAEARATWVVEGAYD
jgi:protein ImuB